MSDNPNKRKADGSKDLILVQNESSENKKSKNELSIVKNTNQNRELIIGTERTSKLKSPIIQLSGHKGEIFTCKFNHSGTALASGSYDKEIFLWNIFHEDCINYGVLKGHKGSVLELHWTTDDSEMVSVSSDKSIGVWDLNQGVLLKRIREHKTFVNSCSVVRRGPPYLVSASDDCSSRLFDQRTRGSIQIYKHQYPVTAVTFSDASDQVITGSIDNIIRCWDLRQEEEPLMTLTGHQDSITGLSVSNQNGGSYLLSNSMDQTIRQWDLRPYAPQNRCVKVYQGSQHNHEKNLIKCSWSPDDSRIASGSSDKLVYIWDTDTKKLLYRLPGHTGSINEVVFHPTEPIIASCSADKTIFLGEIKYSDI
ncbi:WD40 repeat-containing protein [Tieghemostelium lacteum]|uniref:WD40 repeat-containing protein n=1 Tax=Tieghemostelium lacteum TaxID=361077 RepID=A0A152A2A9_TIELA|nr:WD40 repeat-containing protein [Tieghemostelium lacteum]|eukprot:KYR00393.1 WD40 repeat-containing protein [Tieghemostelium lacteum]